MVRLDYSTNPINPNKMLFKKLQKLKQQQQEKMGFAGEISTFAWFNSNLCIN
jgi:hypothetical protein